MTMAFMITLIINIHLPIILAIMLTIGT
jgi:hypothetical protein